MSAATEKSPPATIRPFQSRCPQAAIDELRRAHRGDALALPRSWSPIGLRGCS